MDYCVKLEEFEGPLDLLLHLVKESNVDIHKINISKITEEYLKYINGIENLNINNSAEYLVMAATLMEIKSKSLLPKDDNNIIEEEEEDPKELLIERLIEYQKYKEITKNFKELELERKDIYTKAPENLSNICNEKIKNDTGITTNDLLEAFMNYLERKNLEKPITTRITTKEYSVQKRKKEINNYLHKNGKVKFTELFKEYNKSYIIVTFMSILEMANEDNITLKQDNNFADILIELKVK